MLTQEAASEVREIVGEADVVTDRAALAKIARNTYAFARGVIAIVRPSSTEEVSRTVRWAAKNRLSLYPSSRGRNWGYGSRTPPVDEVVLLDLSQMNRILEVDEDLAYARVQAGVSFGELSGLLTSKSPRVMLSAIGGPADSSLVGNVIERGLGRGSQGGDRFMNACNFEVVLADGRVIRTGFGAFANAKAATVHKWGLGPSTDGLFTQSSFGIVTEATLWLQRRDDHHITGVFWIDDDAKGPGRLIEVIRELKLEGTVGSTSLVANDLRRLAYLRQYPWAEAGGKTPLPRDLRVKLRSLGAWSGDITVYGATPAIVEALKERVREKVAPIVDGIFFSDALEDANEGIKRTVLTVHELASGRPLPDAAGPMYWRVRAKPAPGDDPHDHGCGLMWFSPAMPMRAEVADWCALTTERIISSHGLEPNVGLNCFSDRAFDCTTLLAFDRTIEGEDQRASDCYEALVTAFAEEGFYPYRMALGYNHLLEPYRGANILRELRAVLDPHGTLASGRFIE